MKTSGFLKSAFDACRKLVFPTPEERAESLKRERIKDLSLDLARAVRGVRAGEYTEEQQQAMLYSVGPFGGGVVHLPRPLISLSEEQKQWHIRDKSEKLAALGVSQEEISDIIYRSEEAMRNPKPDLPFGF
ncbi:MAG: hypothetical protein ACLFR0_02945 [Alphaproteobacteria bacterium]